MRVRLYIQKEKITNSQSAVYLTMIMALFFLSKALTMD